MLEPRFPLLLSIYNLLPTAGKKITVTRVKTGFTHDIKHLDIYNMERPVFELFVVHIFPPSADLHALRDANFYPKFTYE